MANLQPLKNLLISAYDPGEFIRFIKGLRPAAGTSDLDRELRQNQTLASIVDEGVDLLERYGLIDDVLFELLEAQRPARIPDIRLVARQILGSDEPDNEQEVKELVRQRDLALAEERNLILAQQDATAVKKRISILTRSIRDGRPLQKGDYLANRRYELVRFEGKGGYGQVWSAFDSDRRCLVALKILTIRSEDDGVRIERFKRGARVQEVLAIKISRGVVPVLGLPVRDGKRLVFVMEFMEGGDLRKAVLQGNISMDRAVAIAMEMGEVLHEAHELGYYHRDVKPHNILLDQVGRAKLSDFDLVRSAESETSENPHGTFTYAPDESLEGRDKPDRTADVYSLGMTTLFCLLGRDIDGKSRRLRRERISELSCSDAEKQVLLRAVADEPVDRFPTTAEFVIAFRQARKPQKTQKGHGQDSEETDERASGSPPQEEAAHTQENTVHTPSQSETTAAPCSESVLDADEALPDTNIAAATVETGEATATPRIWRVPIALMALAFTFMAIALSGVMRKGIPDPIGALVNNQEDRAQGNCQSASTDSDKKGGEICGNAKDDDCDGLLDEGCPPAPPPKPTVSDTIDFPEVVPVRFRRRRPPVEVALSELGDSSLHFIRIAPGEFPMGSPGRAGDETPLHQIQISEFLLSDTEVTQQQWAVTMKEWVEANSAGRSSFPDCALIEKPGREQRFVRTDVTLLGDELPMHCVTWFEAVTFANELTRRERAKGALLSEVYILNDGATTVSMNPLANGYRLPSEAEWEFAARSGRRQIYSGTSDREALCEFGNVGSVFGPSSDKTDPCVDFFDGPAPVGSLLPNSFGMYDMLGNVREWVYDWYGPYRGAFAKDPMGPSSGGTKVLRDGDWKKSAAEARTSTRTEAFPSYENFTIGFRLARTVDVAATLSMPAESGRASEGSK